MATGAVRHDGIYVDTAREGKETYGKKIESVTKKG